MARGNKGILETLLPLKPGYGLGKPTDLPNNSSGRTQGYAQEFTGVAHCKADIHPISVTNIAQIAPEVALAKNLGIRNELDIWAYQLLQGLCYLVVICTAAYGPLTIVYSTIIHRPVV
ncbi:hypothetical protein BJX63DRAFT_435929 [Aspergillus granulosus]|uniref:G-patch domain-containing protein n=1 Tax=Aspergillus granulosus TaxID=176169 RepID=A0ABR4GZN5_9EURO